jgi:hypothetical protein
LTSDCAESERRFGRAVKIGRDDELLCISFKFRRTFEKRARQLLLLLFFPIRLQSQKPDTAATKTAAIANAASITTSIRVFLLLLF